MAGTSSTSFVIRHLASTYSGAGSLRYDPCTDWMAAVGLDSVKAILRFLTLTNQLQAQLAIQTAACRTDSPDAWTALDQPTSADRCTGVVDVSASTASKMYARFGLAYNLSAGSANSQGDVGLQVTAKACGSIVGSVTLQCLAPDTSNYFLSVTKWLPAIEAVKVKAALLVSGVVGNFRCRLTYRTAQVDPASVTDNWATADLEQSWHTGNGEFTTGELTLPTGVGQSGRIDDKMWIQFGLQFSVSSGTGGQATVSVVTGTRY